MRRAYWVTALTIAGVAWGLPWNATRGDATRGDATRGQAAAQGGPATAGMAVGGTSAGLPPSPVSLQNQAPVVVSSIPAAGVADVDPAIGEIRVVFSKPMQTDSWSWVQISPASTPKIVGTPRILEDEKTAVLPVQLERGKVYALWLNTDRVRGFRDRAGRPAVPYLLVFETRK